MKMNNKTNTELSLKENNLLCWLWGLQLLIASLYVLASLLVDSNMSLPNISHSITVVIIAVLMSIGPSNNIVLFIMDKRKRWIYLILFLVYILLPLPAFL
jgi:hypothetical protein